MTTNGVSIPDSEKVEIPEGEYVSEEGWIELTNHVGRSLEEELKIMEEYNE